MKQFTRKVRCRIDRTESTLHSWQGKQRSQTSNLKADDENEFSFDNDFGIIRRPKFVRSVSSGQKPIYARIVFNDRIRKHMNQEEGNDQGAQIPKENVEGVSQQEEIQPEPDRRSQQSLGLSEQDYQNHIKPIEDAYKEEFFSSFIEDSIQFEALFYKLAKNKFIRTPITSSPPLIAYYIFCLLVGYKYPDPHILTEHLSNQFGDLKSLLDMIEIGNQQLPLKLLLLSQSVLPGIQQWNLVRLFANYNWEMLKLLNQQDSFNYKLATDDFLKYSDLYKHNKTEIEQHLQQEIYKKQNICIGFIRLIFIYPGKGTIFNIRIPLGDFNEENSFNFKDMKGKNSFDNDAWYTHHQGGHSEKMLLAWLILHQDIIISLILQQITQINSDIIELILAKVYFEITSERRVCNQCVIMLTKFPFNNFFAMIVQNLNSQFKGYKVLQLTPQFQIIVVTQYLCESQNKESGSDNQSSLSSLSKVSRQRRLALPNPGDQKSFIYFEIGQVGIMSSKYLEYRYSNQTATSQISQPIDRIQLINTIFMSSESSESTLQKQKQSSKIQGLISIYKELKVNFQNISFKQMKKEYQLQEHPQNNTQIEQNSIQQIYSLLWLMAHEAEFIPIEVDLFHLRLLMLYCLNIPGNKFFQSKQHGFLIYKREIYGPHYDEKQDELPFMMKLFHSQLNIHLFMKDFSFLSESIQPQLQQDPNQLLTNYNFQYKSILGLQQVFAVVNKQFEERIEIKLIKDQLIGNEQIINQLKKLQNEGYAIQKVQLLICTIQQLSQSQKKYLNSLLEDCKFEKEYHYIYFRKLQTDQEQLENEKQYTIYDLNIFQARYQLYGTQISFYDMDEQINKQKIIIREEGQVLEKQL